MQASQSNNASDLLTLGLNIDPKPDSNLSRVFPSPFSGPILAARRYIERQKGDAWRSGISNGESVGMEVPDGYRDGNREKTVQPVARGPESSIRTFREEMAWESRQDSSQDSSQGSSQDSSRERDRRLERSLYEGHSIEAGLTFDGTPGSYAGTRLQAGERASLTESDGTEPLFRYAVPGPLPDPEVVRNAILRLARESELSRGPGSTQRGDASGAKENVSEPAATREVAALNFGDVARRVWEASVAELEVPIAGEFEPEDTAHVFEMAPATKGAIAAHPVAEAIEVKEGGEMSAPRGVAARQPASLTSITGSEIEAVCGPQRAPAAAVCDVEGQPALAHDACNLLSALTLYGDLLGSAGVLEVPYRHYAGELKLLAVRSRVLIDRLLRNGAAPEQQASAAADFAAPGDAMGDAAQPLVSHLGNGGVVGLDADPSNTSSTASQKVSVSHADAGSDDISDTRVPGIVPHTTGVEAERTNLADLLMRWGSLLSTLAHGTLEVVLGPDCATPIPAGAEAVERILVNLVRNARTATLGGGAIRIGVGLQGTVVPSTDRQPSESTPESPHPALQELRGAGAGAGATMVLTVDDSGCGMAESDIRRILGADASDAPEQQAATGLGPQNDLENSPGQRRGLGLRIVRQLVTATGGSLSIQSWPGTGTRIEIRWPVPSRSGVDGVAEVSRSGAPALRAVKPTAAIDSVAASVAAATSDATSAHRASVSPPVEITQRKAGPDGWSETELRSMVLRLHRAGPQERSPFSRRMSNRSAGPRAIEPGFGAARNAIHSVESNGVKKSDPAQQDTAAKGAIAC